MYYSIMGTSPTNQERTMYPVINERIQLATTKTIKRKLVRNAKARSMTVKAYIEFLILKDKPKKA